MPASSPSITKQTTIAAGADLSHRDADGNTALHFAVRVQRSRQLDEAKDTRLRLSERLQLVMGVAVSPKTRDTGYDWMRDHTDELLSGGAGIFLAARLPQVFGGFCSVVKADAILKDFAPKLAGKTGQLELDRTVERVRSCGVLKDARGAETSGQIAKLK